MHFWHVFESLFSGPFLTIKLGTCWICWPKWRQLGLMPHIYIYMPLDQSATYILGLFQKRNSFLGLFLGKWRRFEGNKKSKNCTKFWCTFWGHFYYKTGAKNEMFSQKAGSRSVECHIYIYIYGGGLIFCLLFWAFLKGKKKTAYFSHFEAKRREKGRNTKDDQNGSCCFFCREVHFFSAKWPCRGAMWIFWPDFWVEFWKVNFGRWISREWIFPGASFAAENRVKKFDPRIRVQNSGVQNSFSQNSALNSGSGGARSPAQTFVPDFSPVLSKLALRPKGSATGARNLQGAPSG